VDGAQWCLLVYVHPMKRKSYPPNRPEFSKFIAPTICAIVWGPQLAWGKNMECHDIAIGDLILMFKISSTWSNFHKVSGHHLKSPKKEQDFQTTLWSFNIANWKIMIFKR
jgi:hypothetical protein